MVFLKAAPDRAGHSSSLFKLGRSPGGVCTSGCMEEPPAGAWAARAMHGSELCVLSRDAPGEAGDRDGSQQRHRGADGVPPGTHGGPRPAHGTDGGKAAEGERRQREAGAPSTAVIQSPAGRQSVQVFTQTTHAGMPETPHHPTLHFQCWPHRISSPTVFSFDHWLPLLRTPPACPVPGLTSPYAFSKPEQFLLPLCDRIKLQQSYSCL